MRWLSLRALVPAGLALASLGSGCRTESSSPARAPAASAAARAAAASRPAVRAAEAPAAPVAQANAPAAPAPAATLATEGFSVGNRLPEFTLATLDGKDFRASAHRGEVLLLNFFGWGWNGCHAEAPHLESLSKELASKGLVIVGLSVRSDAASAKRFREKHDLTYAVSPEGRVVAEKVGLSSIPYTIVVGRDGIVRFAEAGFSRDGLAGIRKVVGEALAAKA